jgi:hypothetical protein
MGPVGPVRRTRYFCPHCDGSQWLFSLAPVTTDEWVCTKCGRRILLDARAIAHNWLSTITFWALFPLALLLTVFFVAVTRADKMVWALLLGVPVFTVALDLIIYALAVPVALVVAGVIKARPGNQGERRLKTIRREVS